MVSKQGADKKVLVLQGGGALGAYQAGVYAVLHEAGYEPEWLAGISIGSINSALIAGNHPDKRIEKLREFWNLVSSGPQVPQLFFGENGRGIYNEMSAANVALFGSEGFFRPRIPPAVLTPFISRETKTLSVYDTSPLHDTLLELVDFDRLNHSDIRLSIGAVNIRTGNFTYFDSENVNIQPEHIMASGALPEGFPPIEIGGEWFWDGGLVSNTPLQYIIDAQSSEDMCIFQVDLFSAEGPIPKNLLDITQRMQDIRYSSRTRLNTDVFKETQAVRHALKRLLAEMPDKYPKDDDYDLLKKWSCDSSVTIAHLIYRQKSYEMHSKDYEFSRLSVNDHWHAGEQDAEFMLKQKAWINRKKPTGGVKIFDFNRHQKKS